MRRKIPKLKQQNSSKDIVTYQYQRRVETLPIIFHNQKALCPKIEKLVIHLHVEEGQKVLETLFFQSSSKSFTKAK